MTLIASLAPLICWFLYGALATTIESRHPSLSIIMSSHRRRWVENAVHRDTPMDAILSGNLMSSVSFFASTTVLIILAIFATFAQLPAIHGTITDIQLQSPPAIGDIERHIIVAVILFGSAFLSFTLSLRQFNHFCILLGAADHTEKANPAEVRVITALNTLGARNFNQGIRAYYFAIPLIVWFASPIISLAVTLLILISIIYREFFSAARNLVATLDENSK